MRPLPSFAYAVAGPRPPPHSGQTAVPYKFDYNFLLFYKYNVQHFQNYKYDCNIHLFQLCKYDYNIQHVYHDKYDDNFDHFFNCDYNFQHF